MSLPSAQIQAVRVKIDRQIIEQIKSRAVRASNELRNASQLILRGSRGGRSYIVPGTGRVTYNKKNHTAKISYRRYTASAPGQPPAVRTGAFRAGWQREVEIIADFPTYASVKSYIKNEVRVSNGALLGQYLEEGTPGGKMAPRPHHQKIQNKAKSSILSIYREPYF